MATKTVVEGELYQRIDGKLHEIKRQIRQPDGYPFDPGMLDQELQRIVEGKFVSSVPFVPGLVNGMFAPTGLQFAKAKLHNLSHNWGFTDEDFEALGPAPAWPTDSRLKAVILDILLDSVEQTFEEARDAVKSVHPGNWHRDDLKSDKKSLRLLSGNHQRGLHWQVVDLGANINARPIDVRNPATSPSTSILWMAFYSPKWIQAMNGTDVPHVWIPGYECTISYEGAWEYVPVLSWRRVSRGVELELHGAAGRTGYWAVPVILQQ